MKRLSIFAITLFLFAFYAFPAAIAKDIWYSLELGESSIIGQYTLQEGEIRVGKKGSPLDGMKLIIPPGTYDVPQVFTISYRKVTKYNVPDYVLSPLITVSGPRDQANGFVIVKIPCKVPDNSAALVFFYDNKEKFTQSLPQGPAEAGYVTAMTKVFKDMVVVAQKRSRSAAPSQKK
jgi:hypothetical protein